MTVKFKFLSIIISLTVLGLALAGFYSFETYKKDKLALVYDALNENVKNQARLFAAVSEDHDSLLTTIIALTDVNNASSVTSLNDFLEGDQRKIVGIFLQPSQGDISGQKTLYASELAAKITWSALSKAPMGLSLQDKEIGLFSFKKKVSKDGFAVLLFKNYGLISALASEGEGEAFLLSHGKIISKQPLSVSAPEIIGQILPRLNENPGAEGIFELRLSDKDYLVSFAATSGRHEFLINMIDAQRVLLVKDVIFKQIIGFVSLMAFFSMLIGTIAAKWLTRHLEVLTEAVREFEGENFEVQVKISSRDELGILGMAFNGMSEKIRSLLEELRKYNLELEEKVKDRTRELKKLTDIQNGMLNALGQGLVIIDKDHTVLPVYSKIAEEMFDASPSEFSPSKIMSLQGDDVKSFQELFTMAFEGIIGLEDMTRLAPELRSNAKNQRIALSYAPIMNSDSAEAKLDYVMVVGTDKTTEYETNEKFKREWAYSQMVQKIAGNRFTINKLLTESMTMLETAEERLARGTGSAIEIQRSIHTIKGNFSYFYIQDIAQLCHQLESLLEDYLKDEMPLPPMISGHLREISSAIQGYVEKFDDIILYSESKSKRQVSIEDLHQFASLLEHRDPALVQEFRSRFYKAKIAPHFQLYPTIVTELAAKLGKKVDFVMSGGDLEIPEGDFVDCFQYFVHFIRNSLDHGLETPAERESLRKSETGKIHFDFKLISQTGQDYLQITLQDDGRGIDWQKLALKDPQIKSMDDAINKLFMGGLSSRDTVSDLSGRGVGVSAIYEAVTKIGGKCSVSSEQGKGVTFHLKVPMKKQINRIGKLAA